MKEGGGEEEEDGTTGGEDIQDIKATHQEGEVTKGVDTEVDTTTVTGDKDTGVKDTGDKDTKVDKEPTGITEIQSSKQTMDNNRNNMRFHTHTRYPLIHTPQHTATLRPTTHLNR